MFILYFHANFNKCSTSIIFIESSNDKATFIHLSAIDLIEKRNAVLFIYSRE